MSKGRRSHELEKGRGALWIFRSLGTIVCAATLLPLWRGNHWAIRLFDYPRAQFAVLGAVALGAGMLCRNHHRPLDRALLNAVLASLAGQLAQIRRYTPLARKEVVLQRHAPADRTVRMLTANVLMSNRSTETLLRVINERRPQMVLLLEPDRWWEERLTVLERDYPHIVRQAQDNTYGMLLYSKLPLLDPEVRFLVQHDVPSIRARVVLPNGWQFLFYGVHPKPPGLRRRNGEIRGSGPRDAELVVVAKEIKSMNVPVIVAGDFNDVAWSHTTRRFQRIGRVLDPRIGRGFYNTFHAGHKLLRFPLDHMFHSEHFTLVDFAREAHIGSDHFPIFASLCLEPLAPAMQEPPHATSNDHAEAEEDLAEAKAEQ